MDESYNEKIKDQIVALFNYLYIQTTGNRGFRLDLSMQKQDVVLDNFVKKLNKLYKGSVGINFLVSYFTFQFEYWLDKDYNKAASYKMSLTWVIGDKAFKRWLAVKDKEKNAYFVGKNLREKGINVSEILFKFDKTKHAAASFLDSESEHEVREKKRFFNTERGLLHCVENTTLYRKSKACFNCNHKTTCKLILEKKFPQLYKSRFKNEQADLLK